VGDRAVGNQRRVFLRDLIHEQRQHDVSAPECERSRLEEGGPPVDPRCPRVFNEFNAHECEYQQYCPRNENEDARSDAQTVKSVTCVIIFVVTAVTSFGAGWIDEWCAHGVLVVVKVVFSSSLRVHHPHPRDGALTSQLDESAENDEDWV